MPDGVRGFVNFNSSSVIDVTIGLIGCSEQAGNAERLFGTSADPDRCPGKSKGMTLALPSPRERRVFFSPTRAAQTDGVDSAATKSMNDRAVTL